MAEALAVVGAVASIVQLVDFTTKVFERVNHYIHRVDEAPETLRDIGIHLPLFIDSLRRIQFHIDFGHFNPQTSSALKILIDECFSQMNALDNLMTKLTPEQGDSKLTKTRKAILSLKDEKTLERIFSKISDYIKMLLLYQNSVTSTHTMANTKLVLKQIENASILETATRIDSVTTGPLVVDSKSISAGNSTPQAASKSLANYFKRNKQRRISYFMGLARFGLLWAVQADLDLSWGNYGFSISPSLHFQQLVKNTSPGFYLVFKCKEEQLDIQTSCSDLFRLFQTGTVSPWDIFPDGMSWLERLLKSISYSPTLILEFVSIVCKCSAPIRTKRPLLSLVAGWNSRGIHLQLLKELLASGYDCSADTTYTDLFDPWLDPERPQPHGFCLDKSCYYDGNEPFLLKFLAECSKNAYGVWGQTPLMDSILCGSIPEISKLLEHPFSLRGSNSLGQTAAHVAVLRPDVLSMLLQNFFTLDVAKIDEKDSYGNSPLTYAAAYGQTDSVIHLLKAGADPLMDGHLEFLQWALFWDHWDVATEAFAFFRATARFSEAYLQSELHHMMAPKAWYHGQWWWQVYRGRSAEFLGKLFNLGLDKHMLSEDGNTLLHLAYDPMWTDCLFNAGFSQIDHCNNEGETALMTFVQYRSRLVRQILRRGCNTNYRNIRGETALSKACAEVFLFWFPCSIHKTTLDSSVLEQISTDLAVIANLLQHGADTSIHDNCRCPCAPDGCSPLRRLLRSHGQSIGYIWIIECLLMLIEIQGRTIAENAFLEIKRLHEFQLADMTHVCCNRKYSCADEPMDEAEVDEIIEEEKEFVAILDEKMREISSSADNKSIEESWLSILFDFRIPDKPFKSKKYWMSWGSGVEYYYEIFPEMVPLTSSTLISHDNMKPGIRADEETDKYWTLGEVTDGHAMPQSSTYSAWVEWVYQNPDKYDYPLPVDRDWYEKRKYWATRQAQVLEGLS